MQQPTSTICGGWNTSFTAETGGLLEPMSTTCGVVEFGFQSLAMFGRVQLYAVFLQYGLGFRQRRPVWFRV